MPKKKIKDLTLEECKKICYRTKGCYTCPLFYSEDFHGKNVCLGAKNLFEFINQEIEVEEDEV